MSDDRRSRSPPPSRDDRRTRTMDGCRIYVGNLPMDVREREIDDLFHRFGSVQRIQIKTPARPPAYAFVTFDDARDAEDAVRGRDGYDFDGGRLRVEISRGPREDWRRGGGGYDDAEAVGRERRVYGAMRSDGYRAEKPYDRGDGGRRPGGPSSSSFGATRKTDHQVKVEDLPRGADWRDVKDTFRRAGEVTYAGLFLDRDGRQCAEVHFASEGDADRAVDMFDDRDFETRNGQRDYIRVFRREPRCGPPRRPATTSGYRRSRSPSRERYGGRSRSRSRTRSRSRSRSRGGRSMSRSRSPSPSPRRRSRSPSRSRSDDTPRGRSPTPRGDRAREPPALP